MFSHWYGRACHLALQPQFYRFNHRFSSSCASASSHGIVRFSTVSSLHVISIGICAPSNRLLLSVRKKNTFVKWVWHYWFHSIRFSHLARSSFPLPNLTLLLNDEYAKKAIDRLNFLTAHHSRLLRSFVGFACVHRQWQNDTVISFVPLSLLIFNIPPFIISTKNWIAGSTREQDDVRAAGSMRRKV